GDLLDTPIRDRHRWWLPQLPCWCWLGVRPRPADSTSLRVSGAVVRAEVLVVSLLRSRRTRRLGGVAVAARSASAFAHPNERARFSNSPGAPTFGLRAAGPLESLKSTRSHCLWLIFERSTFALAHFDRAPPSRSIGSSPRAAAIGRGRALGTRRSGEAPRLRRPRAGPSDRRRAGEAGRS